MSRVGSSNYLRFCPYQIVSSSPRLLEPFESHWFLIQVISCVINLSTFGNTNKIYFSSENMVANGWFKMYIDQKQFQYLKESTYFELYPIEDKKKIQISLSKKIKNNEFYVYACSEWIPPSRSRVISRISDNIFLVENFEINDEIKKDRCILKIKTAGQKRKLNRYTTGFLQTGQQISYYKNNIYAPLRPLQEIGLDGSDQIVNVVDSGIDVFNAFFYDPDQRNDLDSITNRTNMNHRKVVRIESIVDNTDDIEGHGSHVAGTICGSSFCTDCGISQYNGIAPNARIYFTDIGDSKSGELTGTVDLDKQAEIFKELDVHISSNSWGYSTNEPEIQFSYNKAAYEHPEILYLFANGNNAQYNTINCPANAKNVLAVTSSEIISAANFDVAVTQVDIVNKTYKITTLEMMGRFIRQYSISPKMKYLHDLPLIKYNGPYCHYFDDDYTEFNCSDTDFDYNLYNNSVVLLDSKSGVDEDLCIQVQKVAQYGGLASFYSPQDFFHRCDTKPTIPMIIIENESISDLLKMGNISIFPSSGTDDPLPGASFGASKGPADSGLRKPEIMTPGSHINSAQSHGPDIEDVTVTDTYNDNVIDKSGTSMAAPAAAGLATIIVQYLNDGFYPFLKKGTGKSIKPTSCLLRGLLVNTAIKPKQGENESKSMHRNDVGFGFPFLQNILGFNKTGLRFTDNQSIGSNNHIVYTINLDSNITDLHVTLVYLDPPLNIDNEAIFFADLDLYVKAPNGEIYHGNNVSDGDTFAVIEKVVFDSHEISPNGGQFEIHVVSNKFPIADENVLFAIVINGPFNMTDIHKNPLELVAHSSSENDCPENCNFHGKCVKGICVCDSIHTGLSCGINQSILYDGSSIDEDLEYGDVRYFLVKLNESELAAEKVSFDIVKSDNLGLLYFCTSFEESPGKFTGSDWDCRFACPPNISDPDEEPDVEDYPFFENVTLSIPEGEDHSFFRIAVYTGNYEKIKVSVNNLRISYAAPDATDLHSNSPIQTPTMTESQTHSNSPIQTPSPSIIITTFPLIVNKFPTLSIICLAFVGVFIIVSFTIIVVVLMKKKRVGEIKSSINEKLIDNKDASAF